MNKKTEAHNAYKSSMIIVYSHKKQTNMLQKVALKCNYVI